MATQSIITLESVIAISSIAAAVTAIIWSFRKDKRANLKTLMDVNDRIVEGLEKQNQLLTQQNNELKSALDRERGRNERLETRVDEMQRQYNQLVLSITMGDICLNAKTCQNYNPGDRRGHPDSKI